jgi:hypothetical protein
MTRTRLTLAVMLSLTASYQLYAQWARSLTKAQPQPQLVQQRVHQEPVTLPPETFVEVAQKALPHVEWLRNPDYTYQRDNEFFIYASSFELTKDAAAEKPGDSGERIKLAPCVLIWINPDRPSATPYVVQCEAARVQFQNPVQLGFNAPSPGRLKAAAFDGVVEITGPDGLHLVGQNFDFSEESRSLYSPHDLTFAYGPTDDSPSQVRGSALGVRVTFSPNLDRDLKPEMPRIGGLERVRLLQKVVLDCQYEDHADRKHPELAFAHISCDDALDFNAVDNEAILLSNVLVERPTGGAKRPDEADSLRCHQLSLRFVDRDKAPKPSDESVSSRVELVSEEAESPIAESPTADSPFGALRIKEVEALGTLQGGRAMLQSDKQRLTAHMQLMRFDVDTATAVLSDEAAVNVVRDGTQLRCKTIRIARDPATGKQVLTCLGRGLLQHHDDKTGDLMLEANWVRQLHAAPDPATGLLLVHLDEDARLIVQERAGLRADHLALWIDDRTATEDPGEIAPAAPAAVADAAGGESHSMPLRFFEARGSVIVANSEMRAETELLQAVVEPGTLPHQDVDKTRQASAEGQPDPADPSARKTQDDPWQISSRKVELWLLNPPDTRDVQVSEIVADGEIVISQTPAAGLEAAAPVSLSGAKLHLINEGGVHQHVNVTGAPAMMRRGDMRLEGRDLRLDRSGNRATIVGEGLLQAPVDHDLNGVKLDQPMILDVKWQEGMTFDGAVASFRKRVLLQLHDSVLQCDEMDVRLDKPIRFSDERPVADERPVLRDVSCRNGVHVEIYDWKENKIVGIRKGDLTQFLLDYQTGEFQGDGPGHVNHWSRSEGRRVAIAPPKAAQANVAVSSDGLDWEHISVEFDDLLLGNFKNRTARLHGRVQLIYAPVRRVSETFKREDLSGNSPSVEHAVWLGCNTLAIELHSPPKSADGSAARDDYLVITADNLCELEGQLFHAKADSLSYDESKVQFTLRGKGTHAASIYYQERPKAESQRIAGQIIQFFPSLQKVILEKSSGFQISQ